MKKIALIICIVIVSIVALICALIFRNAIWRGTEQDCSSVQASDMIAVVQNDYLNNRFPRWEKDKNLLETESPKLTFSTPQESDGAYLVPFTAVGKNNKIDYFGLVDCKYHTVEYSSK
jgi:Tfp pilus assembly protein PilE